MDSLTKASSISPPTSNKRIYKVVLTGGPCGGKTTGQSRLSTFFENMGWKVYRVPEAAATLLGGGVKFADLSEEAAMRFQENLLLTMLQLEQVFFDLATASKSNCLIICDRGAMDASAYIPQQAWDEILRRNDFNPAEFRDTRYNQIIHMVSAAVGAEEFYVNDDSFSRFENLSVAAELDRKAGQAWIGHPYFDVIDNTSDFDTKIRRMISMVCQKIGVDTGDRLRNNARKIKYLVKGPLPPVDQFPKFQDFTVEHVYLRTNSRKMQARIRKRGTNGNHSYTYTIRKPEKLGQIVEVRTQVSQRDWNTAKSQADDEHFPIYKTRRCFLQNEQYFQLDIYREPCHKRCQGLMLLETYSTLEGDAMTQRLPTFLNIVKEVTGMPDYSMYNLSLREEWSKSTKFCVNIAGKERSSLSASDSLPSNDQHEQAGSSKSGSSCLSDTSSGDAWDDVMRGSARRLSECCDKEWEYWQTRIPSLHDSDEDDACDPAKEALIFKRNGDDDKFYDAIDKRYNGNRIGQWPSNGVSEGNTGPNDDGKHKLNGNSDSSTKQTGKQTLKQY